MEIIILIIAVVLIYGFYSALRKPNKEKVPEKSSPLNVSISLRTNAQYDNHDTSTGEDNRAWTEKEQNILIDAWWGKASSHGKSRIIQDQPDKVWIPQNQSVDISGYKVDGGMMYVGEGLSSVRNDYSPEPALINPRLKVNKASPDYVGSSMTYWPSYSDITPEARAAYLEWLATGRKNPDTYIGYVFLFFYGLERRLLVDSNTSEKARSEATVIIIEVERLLGLYGTNGSFQRYASNFLDLARLKFKMGDLTGIEGKPVQWGEYPLSLKIALAQLSKKQEPIPAKYALLWAECSPETSLRTPIKRCRHEFEKLFEIRYKEKFGNGLVIEPNKSYLKVDYRPATSSIYPMTYEIEDMPDLTRLTKPVFQIREIIDGCAEELDSYSRFIGRKPDEKLTIAAISLLPKELIIQLDIDKIINLRNWLGNTLNGKVISEIEAKELLNKLGWGVVDSMSKSDCVSVAQLLMTFGYGIEPDIRFGDNKIDPDGKVVLFLSEGDEPRNPSATYKAAATVLHLASAISAADGVVSETEELHLEKHLESALELSQPERKRLHAYLRWLILSSPRFSSLKKHLVSLDERSKESIASFLINIAYSDGVIDPDEIKTLKKIYRLLGLDEGLIYSDIHKLQTTAAGEPVTIQKGSSDSMDYLIPENDITQQYAENRSLVLDHTVIDEKLKDTREIQILLGSIFAEEENITTPIRNEAISKDIGIETVFGLDTLHSQLVRDLIGSTHWSRSDFEGLCDKYGLMPDGAMETINNSTFGLYDESLIEENEDIEINQEISKEITS